MAVVAMGAGVEEALTVAVGSVAEATTVAASLKEAPMAVLLVAASGRAIPTAAIAAGAEVRCTATASDARAEIQRGALADQEVGVPTAVVRLLGDGEDDQKDRKRVQPMPRFETVSGIPSPANMA
jgi:hypothetical protein